ncbi:unnamed protein product [Lasius platythorax]|uniref:Uncharacterized protein n=1 Tax=Lasius platythorax TaxID=488582 RepID=A0AAV2P5A5_9HYME
MALRRNIRKAKNSAIFRDGNARVLTRNAVGHSARSADAHVCVWSDRSVCVYVDAANRYIALVQPIARIYTARLHVLPRDPLLLVAQQCAIASSAARRRYRLGEGEATSDVSIVIAVSSRRAVFKLIRHRQEEEARRYLSATMRQRADEGRASLEIAVQFTGAFRGR